MTFGNPTDLGNIGFTNIVCLGGASTTLYAMRSNGDLIEVDIDNPAASSNLGNTGIADMVDLAGASGVLYGVKRSS